jgi:Ca-activated chloride channel homolog
MGTQSFKQSRFAQTVVFCLAAFVGLVLQPAHGNSQQQNLSGGSTREIITRIETNVVTLTVTVSDARRRFVPGLAREHFEVFDDELKQSIEYFAADDVPVSLGIIFDVSSSMQGKLAQAREALKAFIQTSHADDDFFLIGFNQRPQLLAEFTDGNTLLGKLSLIGSRGETALFDATYLGVEKVLQGRQRRRALLLISDGQDNSSRYTYGQLRRLLKEVDVLLYCVGISGNADAEDSGLELQGRTTLEEIARITGGKAFFPRSAAELEEITTRIALELRQQYSIGYLPTNTRCDGKWRKLRVRINPPRGLPNFHVRAREGYYAVSSR